MHELIKALSRNDLYLRNRMFYTLMFRGMDTMTAYEIANVYQRAEVLNIQTPIRYSEVYHES